jgi:hypothetical protein
VAQGIRQLKFRFTEFSEVRLTDAPGPYACYCYARGIRNWSRWVHWQQYQDVEKSAVMDARVARLEVVDNM